MIDIPLRSTISMITMMEGLVELEAIASKDGWMDFILTPVVVNHFRLESRGITSRYTL